MVALFPQHKGRKSLTKLPISAAGLGQQADGTSSRRDFRPKIKLYKHLKPLFFSSVKRFFSKFQASLVHNKRYL